MSQRRDDPKKYLKRLRQKAKRRETYIAEHLPQYLRLLAEQAALMASLRRQQEISNQV